MIQRVFRFETCALALLAVLAIPSAAKAEIIIPGTDYGSISATQGDSIVPTLNDDFLSVPGNDVGDLKSDVFFNSSTNIFTYVFRVTPGVRNVSEVNTAFLVDGFNLVAGFSYSESGAAGGTGTAADFIISFENTTDGTLDFEAELSAEGAFFDTGEAITFFFQSEFEPVNGDYNFIDHVVGTATGYAPVPGGGGGVTPVPEPSTMLVFALGTALALGANQIRRKRN